MISTLLFVIMFAVMSAFLMGLTQNLTQPLRQLTDKLIRLEPGENIPALPGSVDNEIIFLTNAIQGYLSEIYDQNQRLTEERHRTLIAHYDAVGSELNPHFLYNTLSVIGMTGLALRKYGCLRYVHRTVSASPLLPSYTGQSVLLSQEIDNARHYLYIMKIRYEDDLKYEWQLDDSLNDITVPKLILQPLIENCFQHGFHQAGTEILPHGKYRSVLTTTKTDGIFPLPITERLSRKKSFPIYAARLPALLYRKSGYGSRVHFPTSRIWSGNTILRLHIYYHGEEYFHVSEMKMNRPP
ncbi:MAG: sensor histidine kinase [Blautia massiliensis (ex Durand et al. 2017)]